MAELPLQPSSPSRNLRTPGLWLEATLGVLGGLLVFFWMRLFPESAARLGLELHHGVLFLLLFCALAVLALGNRGSRFPALSFALVAGILMLQLWWLWHSGFSDTMLVGGLLPFSDAGEYLISARVLATGQSLQGIANNHTLANAMLGALWKLTQGDYRLILALITLLGAASAWVAMAEVSLLLGAGAATAWLLVDLLFLRRFIGVPLSEHLGVILGNLGVAFGCRAVRTGNEGNWVLGMFSITLALCARPGALLTLPALLVGAFLASPFKKARRWALPGAMLGALVAAILVNRLLSQAVGKPDGQSVSNAVYILQSIVHGGTWKDAMNHFGDDRVGAWRAVKAQIEAHPMSLVAGVARSLWAFVSRAYLFSFVIVMWLNAILHLAFATGAIVVLTKCRSDRRAWWLLAYLFGLAASIPFLPPWDTDNMRAYAASIPMVAFTVGFGVHVWFSGLGASHRAPQAAGFGSATGPSMAAAHWEPAYLGRCLMGLLAAILLLCALIPPLLRKPDVPLGSSLEDTYAQERSDGTITYSPRIALRLVSSELPSGIPALRWSTFRTGLSGFARLFPAEARLLAALPDNCAVLPGFHEFSFIAIDASHIPAGRDDSTISVQFKFFADDLMLVAVDEALLSRSPALAAYDSAAIGPFSCGLNRFPVLRTDDTISLGENVATIDFQHDAGARAGVDPTKPLILGSRRLNFPVPGEYHLMINHRYPLKVLVLERGSNRAESNRLIEDFVAANSVLIPDEGGLSTPELSRFFESKSPARLNRGSMDEITALLENGPANSQ
jgi:hypothetical protein